MPDAPDAHSTAVCRLFLDLLNKFPESMGEPMEGHWQVRDAHWFAHLLLRDWQDHQRQRLDGKFYPFPWYREKAVCVRAAFLAGYLAREELSSGSRLFCSTDKERLWNILEECVGNEAENEYRAYAEVLAQRLIDGGEE